MLLNNGYFSFSGGSGGSSSISGIASINGQTGPSILIRGAFGLNVTTPNTNVILISAAGLSGVLQTEIDSNTALIIEASGTLSDRLTASGIQLLSEINNVTLDRAYRNGNGAGIDLDLGPLTLSGTLGNDSLTIIGDTLLDGPSTILGNDDLTISTLSSGLFSSNIGTTLSSAGNINFDVNTIGSKKVSVNQIPVLTNLAGAYPVVTSSGQFIEFTSDNNTVQFGISGNTINFRTTGTGSSSGITTIEGQTGPVVDLIGLSGISISALSNIITFNAGSLSGALTAQDFWSVNSSQNPPVLYPNVPTTYDISIAPGGGNSTATSKVFWDDSDNELSISGVILVRENLDNLNPVTGSGFYIGARTNSHLRFAQNGTVLQSDGNVLINIDSDNNAVGNRFSIRTNTGKAGNSDGNVLYWTRDQAATTTSFIHRLATADVSLTNENAQIIEVLNNATQVLVISPSGNLRSNHPIQASFNSLTSDYSILLRHKDLQPGSGISFTNVGTTLTINSQNSGLLRSINSQQGPGITLQAGSGIVISTPSANVIQIDAVGGGGSGLRTATYSFSNVTSFTFTHSLGTNKILWDIYRNTGDWFLPDTFRIVDNNNVFVQTNTPETGTLVIVG